MQYELAERLIESLPKVLGACREFTGSVPKVIESLSGRRQEFARRRPRDLSKDRWELPKSLLG
ncbi:hypothetical protein B296_00047063, partial [Ensete ventricosum]